MIKRQFIYAEEVVAIVIVVIMAGGLYTIIRLATTEVPSAPLNINRIEAIGSPSGVPVIIYDPDRNRIMINTKNLPNGLDICIDGVCARDVNWKPVMGSAEAPAETPEAPYDPIAEK